MHYYYFDLHSSSTLRFPDFCFAHNLIKIAFDLKNNTVILYDKYTLVK